MNIIVNGRTKQWPKARITYDELCILAFEHAVTKNIVLTALYKRKDDTTGSLVAGDTVKVTDNMSFNIMATNRA